MTANEKYKMFRNFMVNELGIGRDDIEEWTKEAVREQVTKLVGQLNMDGTAYRVTRELLMDRTLRQQIAQEVVARFTIAVKEIQETGQ